MKYCPYCGVSLSGGAASFCPECGKALRKRANEAHGIRRRRPPSALGPPKERQGSCRTKNLMDEHYDGYYDDVQPVDADQIGKQRDPELIKRIACVIAAAVGIIALAVILMTAL